ncbi:MAG: hypothetical protein V3U60_16470 [Gammaproteobacteria bacterium]
MDQDAMKAGFELIGSITKAVEGLPYRDARPALESLNELHDMIGEGLPGGYFGQCEACETLLGNDDEMALTEDDITLCVACCD